MPTYTVTTSFSADTTAIASEVNQNNTDLLTALNAFSADNLLSGTLPLGRIVGLTTTQFAAATLVLESEGISSNDNDTTIPTSAAVKDFVDTRSGWTPSISTGYAGEESITFPNGMVMKMGNVAYTSTGTKTITFGSAFPTAIVSVVLGPSHAAHAHSTQPTVVLNSEAVGSFQVYISDQPSDINWIAIGY